MHDRNRNYFWESNSSIYFRWQNPFYSSAGWWPANIIEVHPISAWAAFALQQSMLRCINQRSSGEHLQISHLIIIFEAVCWLRPWLGSSKRWKKRVRTITSYRSFNTTIVARTTKNTNKFAISSFHSALFSYFVFIRLLVPLDLLPLLLSTIDLCMNIFFIRSCATFDGNSISIESTALYIQPPTNWNAHFAFCVWIFQSESPLASNSMSVVDAVSYVCVFVCVFCIIYRFKANASRLYQ